MGKVKERKKVKVKAWKLRTGCANKNILLGALPRSS